SDVRCRGDGMAATPLSAELMPDWDKWLLSQKAPAGFCQTSHWARIHAAVNGATSHVISFECSGARVAGVLVSLRPGVLPNTSVKERLRSQLMGRAAGTLECFEGPILPCADFCEALVDLLRQVRGLAERLGVNHVQFAGAPVLAPWAGSDE